MQSLAARSSRGPLAIGSPFGTTRGREAEKTGVEAPAPVSAPPSRAAREAAVLQPISGPRGP